MGTLFQDLRYGLRMLAKNPGFTAVAVVTLALGIGANTAIFSLIDAEVLRTLPVKNPEELVGLRSTLPHGGTDGGFPIRTFELIRDRSQVMSGMFALDDMGIIASIDGQSELIQAESVSGSYHAVMGIKAILGRTFTPDDDQPRGPRVAVIGYGFWRRRLGLSPSAVGKTISLKGIPFTIVGVMPDIERRAPPDVLVPVVMHSEFAMKDNTDVAIQGRLKPGVREEQASAELSVVYQQVLAESSGSALSPERQRDIAARKIVLIPAGRGGLRHFTREMRIMLAVVGLVLLIACANVASLFLARALARQKEIAVRLAIGASRGRLIRQLLTESVLLALVAGSLGLLFATWGGHLLWAVVSSNPTPISPDSRILGFTVAVSVLTGILFGFIPAFRATRVDLSPALKENLRNAGHTSPHMGRVRLGPGEALVVTQVALSLVVLIGAGLLIRSLRKLYEEDLGFNRESVLTMWAFPTLIGYEGQKEINLYWQLLDGMNVIPGVRSASLSRMQILIGYWEDAFSIPGYSPRANEEIKASYNAVAPKFFETMGIPMPLGRDFSPVDSESASRVVIISEHLARQYFPGGSPLGKRIVLGEPKSGGEAQIVGVVKDIKSSLREAQLNRTSNAIYIPFPQAPPTMLGQVVFRLRSIGNPTAITAAIRDAVQRVDKDLPLGEFATEAQVVDESLGGDRALAQLSSFFGVLALLLASIGLYGTISYSVSRRTKEIGIRMALGARRKHLLELVLAEGLLATLAGLGVGLVGGLALTRVVASQLYGVSATDPLTFVGASLVLVAVTLVACYIPARRATKVDPMVALRYE